MNVSGVTNAANTSYTYQTQTQNSSYLFSEAMEKARNADALKAHASLDAAKRAADVRAGLDAETLGHLNKYTEIYNKYASQYGDGFELNKTIPDSVTEQFRLELYEAGIPGCGKRMTVEDFEAGQFTFMSPLDLANQYQPTVPALFYAEKYGLAGLSKEEQCKTVLDGLQTSTANNLREAGSVLYRIGAISFRELTIMNFRTSAYAAKDLKQGHTQAEFEAALETPVDWSGLLKTLEDSDQSLCELLSKAWESSEETAEDEKLKAIFKKVDAYQEAIHEAIEYRIQKRREQELLDRAAAESARLRIMFGLDTWSGAAAADLGLETADIGALV